MLNSTRACSDRFKKEAEDLCLQFFFVRVELQILFPLYGLTHGGLDAAELFVLQTLSKLRELLRNEVGGRILRKAVGHTEGESAVILQSGSHLGIEHIEEDALTVHADGNVLIIMSVGGLLCAVFAGLLYKGYHKTEC